MPGKPINHRRPSPEVEQKQALPPANLIARLDHIYDLRRNCLLNELYYGYKLRLFSTAAFWLEIVIVIGSGASGVSGWIIWTTYPGLKAVWAVIAAASTLVAALKPVLHIDARLKRYSSLFSSYKLLSTSMGIIVEDIAEAHSVPLEIAKEVDRVRARYKALSTDDDPHPSTKLLKRLQDQVNQRVPTSSLFYPTPGEPPRPHRPNEGGLVAEMDAIDIRVDPVEPWPTPKKNPEVE